MKSVVRYQINLDVKTLLIGEQIGSGKYGVVYKAVLDGYGAVAAKVVDASTVKLINFLYSECDVSTFDLPHAILLKRLVYNPANRDVFDNFVMQNETGNPNITFASPSEDCEYDTIICIYDYVDGITLASDVAAHKTQSITYTQEIVHRYTFCLLRGLVSLVDAGIAHRDIKPENVMIQRGDLKYIDFGLSCKYEKCPNRLIGTLKYIPLDMWEYAAGKINATPEEAKIILEKSDVYALGLTICSMLFDKAGQSALDSVTVVPASASIEDKNRAYYDILSRYTDDILRAVLLGMINEDVKERSTAKRALEMITF